MNLSFLSHLLKRFLNNKIVLWVIFSIGWVGGLVGLGWGGWHLQQVSQVASVSPPPQTVVTNMGQIVVEVAGAVRNPGIYTTEVGSRWGHVLDQAGGLVTQADLTSIQAHVNLASKPKDGEKLYLPFIGEKTSEAQKVTTNSNDQPPFINLNTALASELDSLPGIGEKTVAEIVAARPFSSIQELLTKKIVGEKVFSEIEKLVSAP